MTVLMIVSDVGNGMLLQPRGNWQNKNNCDQRISRQWKKKKLMEFAFYWTPHMCGNEDVERIDGVKSSSSLRTLLNVQSLAQIICMQYVFPPIAHGRHASFQSRHVFSLHITTEDIVSSLNKRNKEKEEYKHDDAVPVVNHVCDKYGNCPHNFGASGFVCIILCMRLHE